MSAYKETETHIGCISRWIELNVSPENLSRIDLERGVFRILAEENIRSLRHRYQDVKDGDDWATPVEASKPIYEYPLLTDAEFEQAIRGYDYQACEHPDYQDSDAYKLVRWAKAACIEKNLTPEFKAERDRVNTWSLDDDFGADRPQGPVPMSQLFARR